ncbi:hypothetical protein ScPMuIL_005530 [Solemya velum]
MSGTRGKGPGSSLTVEQIQEDVITQLAAENWSRDALKNERPFKADIVDSVYEKELIATRFSTKRIMMLEFSQYLENYLWPNFSPEKSTHAHLMSVVLMVNEKFRERVPPWECFRKKSENFAGFFHNVLKSSLDHSISLKEQSVLLVFLIHCFNSLEMDLIREQVQRLVSLPIWMNLLPGRREELFKSNPKYKRFFHLIRKNDGKLPEEQRKRLQFEREFLANTIEKFLGVLCTITEKGKIDSDKVHYCEHFLELLIDIEAQLPTRRFFNAVMDGAHIVVKSQLSNLINREEGKLFGQLLDMLRTYADFEINDQTGEALTIHDRIELHYSRVLALQKVAFKHFPELQNFAISNVASVDSRDALYKFLKPLSMEELAALLSHLNLVPSKDLEDGGDLKYDDKFLLELLATKHERQPSQLERINEMPLYPTEKIIWDENVVPSEYFSGEEVLALPKLNLQFLTLHDYLLRNFDLFRLESTYEIRQDIEDACSHLKPWKSEDGSCLFGGWARMAQQIAGFNVVEVGKPHIGESHPSLVRADVTINLSLRPEIKNEWESLRKHDVAFLITLRPTVDIGHKYNHKEDFIPQVGLCYVRGCEIEGMLDDEGKGERRTFRVWLDANQYQQDMTRVVAGDEDVYETFNVIMRRKPKENNFKAVLETMRDLMNTDCVVPDWLHDLILGYGDPDAAHYSKMPNKIATLDWNDTFLGADHLRASFPDCEVVFDTEDKNTKPPYRNQFITTANFKLKPSASGYAPRFSSGLSGPPRLEKELTRMCKYSLKSVRLRTSCLDIDDVLVRLGHGGVHGDREALAGVFMYRGVFRGTIFAMQWRQISAVVFTYCLRQGGVYENEFACGRSQLLCRCV